MLYRRLDRLLIQINDPVDLVGSVDAHGLIEFELYLIKTDRKIRVWKIECGRGLEDN
jgi:hypothetical protein